MSRGTSPLSPKDHEGLIDLVGKQCNMLCLLEGVKTEVLWDTGAQVCLLPYKWAKEHLRSAKIQPIAKLLDAELKVKAADGQVIPFKGWLPLTFQLLKGQVDAKLNVPFLVTDSEGVDVPIIGYNVIEHYLKGGSSNIKANIKIIQSGLPTLKQETLTALVNFIGKEKDDELGQVSLGRQRLRVPKGATREVKCITRTCLKEKVHAIFEPETANDLPEGVVITGSVVSLPWLLMNQSQKG